ncbi:MAG: hypothetical protein C0412_02770 [Flavobacterium sp.]|nr:hypothetical protein [Flavobacterium sp.]
MKINSQSLILNQGKYSKIIHGDGEMEFLLSILVYLTYLTAGYSGYKLFKRWNPVVTKRLIIQAVLLTIIALYCGKSIMVISIAPYVVYLNLLLFSIGVGFIYGLYCKDTLKVLFNK